ncbi:MAG: hypothetical protein ABWY12_09690 [Burkholderiales bacterium]
MSDFQLGQIAYTAYCESAGGVSLITGDKLPTFLNLKADIQNAWIAAAKAVTEEVA